MGIMPFEAEKMSIYRMHVFFTSIKMEFLNAMKTQFMIFFFFCFLGIKNTVYDEQLPTNYI